MERISRLCNFGPGDNRRVAVPLVITRRPKVHKVHVWKYGPSLACYSIQFVQIAIKQQLYLITFKAIANANKLAYMDHVFSFHVTAFIIYRISHVVFNLGIKPYMLYLIREAGQVYHNA